MKIFGVIHLLKMFNNPIIDFEKSGALSHNLDIIIIIITIIIYLNTLLKDYDFLPW